MAVVKLVFVEMVLMGYYSRVYLSMKFDLLMLKEKTGLLKFFLSIPSIKQSN